MTASRSVVRAADRAEYRAARGGARTGRSVSDGRAATPLARRAAADAAQRPAGGWFTRLRRAVLAAEPTLTAEQLPDRDRAALERNGWRTEIEFVEHHRRDLDGRLLGVAGRWIATAERWSADADAGAGAGGGGAVGNGDGGGAAGRTDDSVARVVVLSAEATTRLGAWRSLRRQVAATPRSAPAHTARGGQTTARRHTGSDLGERKNLRPALARVR